MTNKNFIFNFARQTFKNAPFTKAEFRNELFKNNLLIFGYGCPYEYVKINGNFITLNTAINYLSFHHRENVAKNGIKYINYYTV